MSDRTEDKSRAKRVLLVDDHAIVRRGIADLIRSQPGFEICGQVPHAQGALRAVAELDPDLVVLDLSLPDSTGIELIKRIVASNPRTLVLVYSMHEESLYAQRVLRAGAHGYVSKSESPDRLLSAIRDVLEHKVGLSSAASKALLQGFSAPEGPGSRLDRLTDRELEVVQLIGSGLTTRDIARQLSLSIKTIDSHRANIKAKLGLRTASELAAMAARLAINAPARGRPWLPPPNPQDAGSSQSRRAAGE